MENLRELNDDAWRLIDLLADPHPGLVTWREALDAQLAKLDLYSAGTAKRFDGLKQVYPELAEMMEKPLNSRDSFVEHLEHASSVVSTWPEWKQKLLGGSANV